MIIVSFVIITAWVTVDTAILFDYILLVFCAVPAGTYSTLGKRLKIGQVEINWGLFEAEVNNPWTWKCCFPDEVAQFQREPRILGEAVARHF
jgi:hypothetical protein